MFLSNSRNRIIVLCAFFFSIFIGKGIAQDKILKSSVISSFPSPGPSPQRMTWDGENLWVADDGTNRIYKIDPATGNTLLSFEAPSPGINGLTWDGEYLVVLSDKSKKISRLGKTSEEMGTVIVSNDIPRVPYIPLHRLVYKGLLWADNCLYINIEAGWSSQILKTDLENNLISRFAFTFGNSKDLTFDGTYIWNCCDDRGYSQGWVAQYDRYGKRLNCFNTPGYCPTGVAYDGEYFWVTDNRDKKIYKIKIY